MSEPLVQVDDLEIEYRVHGRRVRALDGATLNVDAGEIVGIVGESGSGKSTLGMSMGRLLPSSAVRVAGDLRIEGRSIFELTRDEIRLLRRNDLGFVFQNPMTSLDPTKRIGKQMSMVLDAASPDILLPLLSKVKLPDPERVAASYPFQLSGGMAQRVAIAMAIGRNPKLIIADEPTAAIDAAIRAQILELMISLSTELGASVLLLSHDLRALARHCRQVAVMYGGRVVETGRTVDVFTDPSHPYSAALLRSAPGIEDMNAWLQPIPGVQTVLNEHQERCPFAPRCSWAVDLCFTVRPEPREVRGRQVVCHRAHEVVDVEAGNEPGVQLAAEEEIVPS